MLRLLPPGVPLLDLGWGLKSWLRHFGLRAVGLDLNPHYVEPYRKLGDVASSRTQPRCHFGTRASRAESFAFGVLGSSIIFRTTLLRVCSPKRSRVCRQDDYVAILDAVMPCLAWARLGDRPLDVRLTACRWQHM